MPAPATADEFLDLVQRSGVADPARLGPYVQKLKEAGKLPAEPSKLAGLLVRDAHLTYFQAEQLLQGKWKRFLIGKYKVLEKLGSGGMGQVFLCEHKLMRRRVAVKVLPTAKAADPSSLQRFYREARAVAALDHPNIVRAYDIDQDENLHFIVMEFVDGTNLQDLVKKFGPLDVLRACHYAYGAAVGLQYAYEMGIVHRDIKPGNILIDRAGVVKILDMGLARFFHDEDDNLTKKYDENVLGTADYLAPEQAVDSSAVDIRADLYSLGGTFYYLLTGLPPFPEGSVAQKLLWHQTRDPKPVRQLRPEVPEELAAVVAKLMAKEPANRYQTPADLIADLAPFVQTPIPPPPEREMPQFSPAAVGVGSGTGTRPALGGVALAGPGSGRLLAGPAGNGGPAGTRGDDQPTLPAGTVPAVPRAAPAAAPAPAAAGVWEELTSETRENAKGDTGSSKKSGRRSARRDAAAAPAATPAGKSRRVRLLAGAAVGLVLLAGGGYALYRALAPADGPHGPSKGNGAAQVRSWYVAKTVPSPDPDHTAPTLLAALRKANPGDTVILLDDTIDDGPIRLETPAFNRLRGVTVEAGNAAKSVRWAPPGAGQARAALQVIGIEGFHVRGLVIDAAAFDVGLWITGTAPGLTVEDVTVQNPRLEGVRVNAAGDPGRPVLLNRVRVTGATPYEVGVHFAGDARVANKHVHLVASRVEGPAKAGVRVTGAAAEVEVRHNRVYNVDAGVVVAGVPADPKAPQATRVRVAGNTFHTVHDAGLLCDPPLPPNLPHEVVVAQNYFARAGAVARTTAEDGKFPALKPDTNARDPGTKEGNVPVNAAAVPPTGLGPADPAAAAFLRYGPDSPLNAVGPQKRPVGVPPQ